MCNFYYFKPCFQSHKSYNQITSFWMWMSSSAHVCEGLRQLLWGHLLICSNLGPCRHSKQVECACFIMSSCLTLKFHRQCMKLCLVCTEGEEEEHGTIYFFFREVVLGDLPSHTLYIYTYEHTILDLNFLLTIKILAPYCQQLEWRVGGVLHA